MACGTPIQGVVGVAKAAGEVGFPLEFGGMVEEPLAAPGDGGFDVGDAVDGAGMHEEAASLFSELIFDRDNQSALPAP